jgi:hypothetical protein
MKKILCLAIIVLTAGVVFMACKTTDNSNSGSGTFDPDDFKLSDLGPYDYAAPFAETAPVIDGIGDDAAWEKAEWKPIDQVWLFAPFIKPDPKVFSGRYKIVWTAERLYYLVEITDNYISTSNPSYPENDCLEFFIDENASGGNHEFNFKAWAYHLTYSLKPGEKDVWDYDTQGPRKFNDHVNYQIGHVEGTDLYTWEAEVKVFADTYKVNAVNTPVTLYEGKKMGFALAYCDADQKGRRERFMGSVFIPGTRNEDRNVAWQNADVFAKLYLVKEQQ